MEVKFQTILCPLDFSPVSEKGAVYAQTLGKTFGGRVVFLHVVEPLVTTSMMGHALQMAAQIEAEMEEQAKKQMVERGVKLKDDSLEFKVVRGKAYEQILHWALEEKADLIVLGTHGRSGLSHLLLGSTAEKVIRKASCPVLTVRGE